MQLLFSEPAFEEGAGVHAGGGVALEIDLIAAAGMIGAAEEVVEADFVERGRGGESRDMAAEGAVELVGLDDHGHGVPADQALDAAFEIAVAGEGGLVVRRDGVDVRRVGGEGQFDAVAIGFVLQPGNQVPGTFGTGSLQDSFEGIEPFACFDWVGVYGGYSPRGGAVAVGAIGGRSIAQAYGTCAYCLSLLLLPWNLLSTPSGPVFASGYRISISFY